MTGGLTEDAAGLLRKIAGRGGNRGPVPLSSVVKEGDLCARESLARLQHEGYVRVRALKPSTAPLEDELNYVSRRYLEAVRALAANGGRTNMAKAADAAMELGGALRRADAERGRVRARLAVARREMDKAWARPAVGGGGRPPAEERVALSRGVERLEASLAFLDALPGPGRARPSGMLEHLDLLADELAARRKVGEISDAEYRRRLNTLDRRRERTRRIAANRPVERRVNTARKALERLRREGRLTEQQYRELSLRG